MRVGGAFTASSNTPAPAVFAAGVEVEVTSTEIESGPVVLAATCVADKSRCSKAKATAVVAPRAFILVLYP
jgi:hypothetical protein